VIVDPPLLAFSSLRVRGTSGGAPSTFAFADRSIQEKHTVLGFTQPEHEAAFLGALRQPALAQFESFRCAGSHLTEAVQQGILGYAPRTLLLPADSTKWTLDELLGASSRLAGVPRGKQRDLLDQLNLREVAKARHSELCALDQRLLGLAHALLTSPHVVVIEDPFPGLPAKEADHFSAVLLKLAAKVRLIVIGSSEPHSAELAALLGFEVAQLASALEERGAGLRVRAQGEVSRLEDELQKEGFNVHYDPETRTFTLFSSSEVGKVLEAARAAEAILLEVTPLHTSGA
jgi:hypothetical protein